MRQAITVRFAQAIASNVPIRIPTSCPAHRIEVAAHPMRPTSHISYPKCAQVDSSHGGNRGPYHPQIHRELPPKFIDDLEAGGDDVR